MALSKVDFPEPLLPPIAIRSRALIEKLNSRKIGFFLS